MLTFFDFESHRICLLMRDDQPWFILADVRLALEHTDEPMPIWCLADDERGVISLVARHERQRLAAVTVSGLFGVVSGCLSPKAMQLRRWLAAEVLPAVFAPEDAALESAPAHDGGLVSTTEIAEAIGIAPSALGRRAAHLKTPLHGEWRHAIGEFSGKVVQQWLWNDAGRAAVLRQFGGRDTSAVIGSSARSRRTH